MDQKDETTNVAQAPLPPPHVRIANYLEAYRETVRGAWVDQDLKMLIQVMKNFPIKLKLPEEENVRIADTWREGASYFDSGLVYHRSGLSDHIINNVIRPHAFEKGFLAGTMWEMIHTALKLRKPCQWNSGAENLDCGFRWSEYFPLGSKRYDLIAANATKKIFTAKEAYDLLRGIFNCPVG